MYSSTFIWYFMVLLVLYYIRKLYFYFHMEIDRDDKVTSDLLPKHLTLCTSLYLPSTEIYSSGVLDCCYLKESTSFLISYLCSYPTTCSK